MGNQSLENQLLGIDREAEIKEKRNWVKALLLIVALATITITVLGLIVGENGSATIWLVRERSATNNEFEDGPDVVQSEKGVVAADDARCSEVGASMLRQGGHAVDAAVATGLCLGVVSPMSSGIGGGAFMVVHSPSSPSKADAFDMRETAPSAASESMYEKNPLAKSVGPLSMGVPGELAGLHKAWLKYGRLPWKTLFQPAIKFGRDGFLVSAYLGDHIASNSDKIKADPGLTQIFAPNGKLLNVGETCYNPNLADSLEAVAEHGPKAFYEGEVGEKLVNDVREAGGILTMEDLRMYKVREMDALSVDVMGRYTVLGMPPPSSGTLGLSMVLKVLDSYGSSNAVKGPLGLHRLIEALKHMFAVRMNLGDPAFVDVSRYMSDMTSDSFAAEVRNKINDNTTFPADYYLSRWSQLHDNGTSHFCVVDSDRNAVSLTTTVNYVFGAGVISPSTGIVLNNEMDDFSTPTEIQDDKLPPAPANFIRPGKRPLSSMTPIIVLKDNNLVGVIGGAGGSFIIPAVIQVFINHFVLGLDPLPSVQNARVYHKLAPNLVSYENVTVIDGEHIELSEERKAFLEKRGHKLKHIQIGAITQLVVQSLEQDQDLNILGRKIGKDVHNLSSKPYHGILTAVSDPRKNGKPACI